MKVKAKQVSQCFQVKVDVCLCVHKFEQLQESPTYTVQMHPQAVFCCYKKRSIRLYRYNVYLVYLPIVLQNETRMYTQPVVEYRP